MILPAQEQPAELIAELRESLGEEDQDRVHVGPEDMGAVPVEGDVPEVEEVEEQVRPEVGQGEVPGDEVQQGQGDDVIGTPGGEAAPRRVRVTVQVPQAPIPQMQDLRPQPQRQRGRRIARPDWTKLLG